MCFSLADCTPGDTLLPRRTAAVAELDHSTSRGRPFKLCEEVYLKARLGDVALRADTAGLLLMANGPYLAWLSLTFLDRLPGGFLQPLPVRFGRYRYRTGFVARRSAEDLAPLRRLEAIVRDIALRQRD